MMVFYTKYLVFQDLERVHNVLKIVFMLFPNYCLGRGLIDLTFNEYKNEYYFKTGLPFFWVVVVVGGGSF